VSYLNDMTINEREFRVCVCVCVCVYIYIYMYVCMYVCMYGKLFIVICHLIYSYNLLTFTQYIVIS
jgi:hypothetical protein